MVVSYVLFPVMLGMSAVAHDMFAVLLGEEWMPTVPYFETVCLVGLFYPMSIIAYNVLKVKSGGALIVKLEIVKKVIMTLVFAVTIPISVQAVVWGLVVIAFCEMSVNFLATTKFTSLSPGRFVRTLLPPLLAAAADVRRGAADGPRDSGACPAAADGRSDGRCGLLCPAVGPVPARSLPRGSGYCPEAVFAPLIRAACVGADSRSVGKNNRRLYLGV